MVAVLEEEYKPRQGIFFQPRALISEITAASTS